MGDEGFDLCECIWGQEMATRRLLNLLRQTQSYCTDTECFQTDSTPARNVSPDEGLFWMGIFFFFTLFMFFMRPNRQRDNASEPTKVKAQGNNGFNGPPPPPTNT